MTRLSISKGDLHIKIWEITGRPSQILKELSKLMRITQTLTFTWEYLSCMIESQKKLKLILKRPFPLMFNAKILEYMMELLNATIN